MKLEKIHITINIVTLIAVLTFIVGFVTKIVNRNDMLEDHEKVIVMTIAEQDEYNTENKKEHSEIKNIININSVNIGRIEEKITMMYDDIKYIKQIITKPDIVKRF